jgi:hypothetical protein
LSTLVESTGSAFQLTASTRQQIRPSHHSVPAGPTDPGNNRHVIGTDVSSDVTIDRLPSVVCQDVINAHTIFKIVHFDPSRVADAKSDVGKRVSVTAPEPAIDATFHWHIEVT